MTGAPGRLQGQPWELSPEGILLIRPAGSNAIGPAILIDVERRTQIYVAETVTAPGAITPVSRPDLIIAVDGDQLLRGYTPTS